MSDSTLNLIIAAKDMASSVLKGVGGSVDALKRKTQGLANEGLTRLNSSFNQTANVLKTGLVVGLTGAIGLMGLMGGQMLKSAGEAQQMRTALTTSFQGNAAEAKKAQDQITAFAAKTPYDLQQVMTGFIKLKNMGLNPSQEAMTAYGDTASAMGKSLNDMVEAVADAATGEFERLKEFGIRASSEGDKVTFTFKGVSTTVKKESKAIEDYLIKLGKTNFAGGMDAQSRNLFGTLATLFDNIKLKYAELADKAGITDFVTQWVTNAANAINSFDIDSFLKSMTNLYNILFKGDYTGGFFGFGSGETSKAVSIILTVRDNALDLYNILFRGDYTGLFGLSEDHPVVIVLLKIAEDGELARSVLAGLAGVIGTVLVGALWSMAVAVIAATWPFVALGIIFGALYYAFENQTGIINILAQQWQNFMNNVINPLIGWFAQLWQAAVQLWEQFTKTQEFDLLMQTFNAFVGMVQGLIPHVIAFGFALGGILAVVGVYLVGAVQLAIYAFQQLYPVFLQIWQAALNLFVAIQPIIQMLASLAVTVVGVIGIILAVLWPFFMVLGTMFVQIAQGLGLMLAGIMNGLAGLINFIVGVFTGDWRKAWEGIKQMFTGFVQFLQGMVRIALSPFTSIIDGIKNIFGTFNLIQMGKDMIQGLINGVGQMAGALVNKVKDSVKGAVDGAKKLLGIQSPSKVFEQFGVYTVQGYVNGVDKMSDSALVATQNMATNAVNGGQSASYSSVSNSNNNTQNQEIHYHINALNLDQKTLEMIAKMITPNMERQGFKRA